jgi:hypothetical protein
VIEWQQQSAVVINAAGMISVQAECTLDEALERLQSRAAATGKTVDQVATYVVNRTIRFSPEP